MGQYYHPTVLKKNWKTAKNPVECSLYSHLFNSGLKLMEHSYAGNGFVGAMCHLLATTYYGYPFVWAGDYADDQITKCHPDGICIYSYASKLCDKDKNKDLSTHLIAIGANKKQYTYLVNLTKGEYCKIPKFNKKEWRVHPLPLLCADGNGRGCGDYHLEDDRIGTWAYDCIGITNSKKAIEGLKEISGFFKMDC